MSSSAKVGGIWTVTGGAKFDSCKKPKLTGDVCNKGITIFIKGSAKVEEDGEEREISDTLSFPPIFAGGSCDI